MRTHAVSCIGETSLQNCQKTKESSGNIGIFLLLKPNFPHTKFNFLQPLSTFFNGFLIFLNGFSIFLNGFPIFLNGFPLSEKSKKIYLGQEVYKRSLFELCIFCHLLSHSRSELYNTRYNTQHTPVVHLCSQQCAISKI
jgi:hypothetical protein